MTSASTDRCGYDVRGNHAALPGSVCDESGCQPAGSQWEIRPDRTEAGRLGTDQEKSLGAAHEL